MDNRQNNQDFTLVSAPGQSLSGNANKIKLKMVSYAAILEVQAAFMEEEVLKKQEELSKSTEEVKSGETKEDRKAALDRVNKISKELADMQAALEELEDYNAKFMDMAKKALKLPNANLEELVATGKTTLDGKVVTKEDISKDIDISSVVNLDNAVEKGESVLKTPDNKSIFSDIDSDEIRRQVEEVINSDEKDKDGLTFTDYVDQKVSDDKTFDTAVNFLAGESKDELDDKIANPEFEVDDLKNMFDEEPERPLVKEQPTQEVKVEPIDIFENASATFVEPDEEKKDNLSTSDSTSFDDDKSMEEFIASLNAAKDESKVRLQDSKNRNAELNNTKRGLDEEIGKADTSLEEAKRRKSLAEKRKKYFGAIMPEIKELNSQTEELNKANTLVEREIAERQERLDSTNSQIANYNNEAEALEREVEEMIKAMKNSNDSYGEMGGSGRTK